MKVNIATSAPTSLDKVEYWKCGPMKEGREREREFDKIPLTGGGGERMKWQQSSISVYSLCEGNNQFARETIDTPALYPLSQLQPKPHPLSHINIVSQSHSVTVSYPHSGGKTALPVICPDMIRRSRAERSASS